MSVAGWALTIAGVPYIFTTSNMGSLTSSSALWWGGETGVSYADGWLTWPRGTISERAKPLEGELDVSPMSFELHDAATSAGGSPLLTGLAGKDAANTASTPLASTITATATSATVGDGGLFSAPCFAWIEGEAVRVSSVAGNVLTIVRGRLGTKATAHTVDAGAGRFPEAFVGVPWTTRRKVHLWRVDAGAATLVWSGYAVRAPKLADDGARFAIDCDPLWTVQAANPVGSGLGSTRFAGYSDGRSRASTAGACILSTATVLNGGARVVAYSNGNYRDLGQIFAHHQQRVSDLTAAAGQRIVLHFARSASGAFTVDGDSTLPWSTTLRWLNGEGVPIIAALRVTSRYSASAVVSGAPSTVALFFWTTGGGTVLVSTLAGLPASWSAVTTTEASMTTSEQAGLRFALSDDWHVTITDVTPSDDGDEYGPKVAGRYTYTPRKVGVTPGSAQTFIVPNPGPLKAVYRVRADHWALGLKHSVVGLCEDAGSLDWDWSSVYTGSTSGPVLRATAGLRVAREWTFEGKRTLGSVVTECCLLHGCTPVVRSGRIALHAWGWPSARDAPVATLTAADIIGRPSWSRWQDGIANRLVIKSDSLNVDATLQQSRARYGPGRQITVELAGIEDQTMPVDDPIAFAREVVGRLELWSDPLAQVTLTLKASLWSTLELGAVLRVSEWMLPNGSGGRGLSAALGVVVGRVLDLSNATMKVDALLFPRRAYPYAPCGKVASVVSSTVAQLATGYVGGTTSYSGGNDAATFTAGDVVELVERDTTTLWAEQLTVASVDAALGRLTFASAMSATAQAKIAGSSWIDVRFADYAACQASQQAEWMFVADASTAVIDGTAEPQRLIAP